MSSNNNSSGAIQMELPPLSNVLEEDRKEDCSAAFIGLGAYTFVSGRAQLREREKLISQAATRWGIGARRMGIYGIAASMVGLGVYRAIM
ncbi:uncharacterized protein H6S33_000890 [Morchella sextelata]|uniref:uncharacterized protein n=1 Tax=Morchella sextelata TaxID=1174677 RepID=UPI001D0469A1|nr:uncharacterized protein H6S33_000890 [Morchella sextelata]KAH0615254.1 hypothetical protein H6S33_000890 [Morchella sextelata]